MTKQHIIGRYPQWPGYVEYCRVCGKEEMELLGKCEEIIHIKDKNTLDERNKTDK